MAPIRLDLTKMEEAWRLSPHNKEFAARRLNAQSLHEFLSAYKNGKLQTPPNGKARPFLLRSSRAYADYLKGRSIESPNADAIHHALGFEFGALLQAPRADADELITVDDLAHNSTQIELLSPAVTGHSTTLDSAGEAVDLRETEILLGTGDSVLTDLPKQPENPVSINGSGDVDAPILNDQSEVDRSPNLPSRILWLEASKVGIFFIVLAQAAYSVDNFLSNSTGYSLERNFMLSPFVLICLIAAMSVLLSIDIGWSKPKFVAGAISMAASLWVFHVGIGIYADAGYWNDLRNCGGLNVARQYVYFALDLIEEAIDISILSLGATFIVTIYATDVGSVVEKNRVIYSLCGLCVCVVVLDFGFFNPLPKPWSDTGAASEVECATPSFAGLIS